ncbi:hypothetical protein [Pelagerythrobacter marensis]|uniref:Uncharacterized protein n=1 Tax=Pelagerythrobacter marensis TaxID=543877 RepID=A0A0G3XAJ7_9SPHN|nr:hypothetical protein [Pelagerythrobacter marensis]AKM07646.1 hypothetical protein AM2010_1577 [Pelagerythrobacter marensis]
MELDVFLPYLGWIILAVFLLGAGGIFASLHTTRMKIKNGYPLEGMWGQSLKPSNEKAVAERVSLLTQENAQLRAELGSMKDRLGNVERIVTDSGYHLTQEIDRLQNEPETH